MKKLLTLFLIGLVTISCNRYSFNEDESIKANSEKIFGVSFPSNLDWVTATKMSANINIGDYSKVLVLCSSDSTIKVLNSTTESGVIYFDVPNTYDNLFLAYVNKKGEYFYEKLNAKANTRSFVTEDLPEDNLSINGTVESFASKREWLPGEIFYLFNYRTLISKDYNTDFKDIFRNIIFNYFPNGKKYNNLSKIKKSGYYNESSYPITTGKKPIIVSPVYKNDGGYHEVSEAELYYYYFKGNPTVQEIEVLPKYRAIDLSEVYGNNDNNVVAKNKSYALVYWGDPTTGTYKFPEGYKIGFMYKSNTETDNKKKQGELYCDGRLNYNINSYGNFKSSKLGSEEPRMAWMSVNEKMFLCVESGTDADFNDLILEIEGGIKPIIIIPDEPEDNFYTFCYEDQRLGDYDLNDVVLKGRRIDKTHIEWTLSATGATDELYIHNIEGEHIKSSIEVHKIFGKERDIFINTQKGDNVPVVKDVVVVNENYSFLDANTQPYIYDATKDWEVRIARRGEDPHAIMIPYDFKWPLERVCIKDAYLKFNNWGMRLIEDTDWFKYPVENLIY